MPSRRCRARRCVAMSVVCTSNNRNHGENTDNTLPASVHQASLADYSSASQQYTRGHMCPSADRTVSVPANQSTFYLTNMVPQVSNNNGGPWAKLENYERSLSDQGKELFAAGDARAQENPDCLAGPVCARA